MATSAQRKHLAALMDWLVSKEPLIDYRQYRPMTTTKFLEQELVNHFAAGKKISSDCSETVTLVCRLAGLADPNGSNYNGYGFTGTMLDHLPHYTDPKGAEIGALVVFGPGDGDHVGMVRKASTDPVIFDHGSQTGPKFRKLSVIKAYHRPPTIFLAIRNL